MALGLERRWNERYRKLQQLLRDGLIGDVTCVAMFGSTSLVYNGCQLYAPALSLAGDPRASLGHGTPRRPSATSLRLEAAAGPVRPWLVGLSNGVHLSVSPEGVWRPAYTVLGSEGRLDILNDTLQVYHWDLDARSGTLASQPRIIDLPPVSEPFAAGKAAVRDLAHAVRTGGKTALDTSTATHVTEIGFAIHASSGAGVRVEIPVDDRTLRVEGPPGRERAALNSAGDVECRISKAGRIRFPEGSLR